MFCCRRPLKLGAASDGGSTSVDASEFQTHFAPVAVIARRRPMDERALGRDWSRERHATRSS